MPISNRIFRVHVNTLEWMPTFLVPLWLCAYLPQRHCRRSARTCVDRRPRLCIFLVTRKLWRSACLASSSNRRHASCCSPVQLWASSCTGRAVRTTDYAPNLHGERPPWVIRYTFIAADNFRFGPDSRHITASHQTPLRASNASGRPAGSVTVNVVVATQPRSCAPLLPAAISLTAVHGFTGAVARSAIRSRAAHRVGPTDLTDDGLNLPVAHVTCPRRATTNDLSQSNSWFYGSQFRVRISQSTSTVARRLQLRWRRLEPPSIASRWAVTGNH